MEKIIKGAKFYEKIAGLKQMKIDSFNWRTYYLDEQNGDKWVEEYLFPESLGGGPPQLRLIDKFPWER